MHAPPPTRRPVFQVAFNEMGINPVGKAAGMTRARAVRARTKDLAVDSFAAEQVAVNPQRATTADHSGPADAGSVPVERDEPPAANVSAVNVELNVAARAPQEAAASDESAKSWAGINSFFTPQATPDTSRRGSQTNIRRANTEKNASLQA